jgi:hypothetical protein
MLTQLTRGSRVRAAIALAALYAVCVVAPALALAGSTRAAHCLTDDQDGLAHVHARAQAPSSMHAHGDGTLHEHADHAAPAGGADDPPGLAGSCCGLFCISAVTGDAALPVAEPVHASRVLPLPDDRRAGRGPDRINRPPISLLSL